MRSKKPLPSLLSPYHQSQLPPLSFHPPLFCALSQLRTGGCLEARIVIIRSTSSALRLQLSKPSTRSPGETEMLGGVCVSPNRHSNDHPAHPKTCFPDHCWPEHLLCSRHPFARSVAREPAGPTAPAACADFPPLVACQTQRRLTRLSRDIPRQINRREERKRMEQQERGRGARTGREGREKGRRGLRCAHFTRALVVGTNLKSAPARPFPEVLVFDLELRHLTLRPHIFSQQMPSYF